MSKSIAAKVKDYRTFIQMGVSSVALLALLVYTFQHTGALLSRYVHPWWVGYIAAAGIELSVVGMSLWIGNKKRKAERAVFQYFVLVSTVVVSAVANIVEGFVALHGVTLTLQTATQLDPVQAVVGVVATGLISVIVLAVAEIVGVGVSTTLKEVEALRRKAVESVESVEATTTTEPITKPTRKDSVVTCPYCNKLQKNTKALAVHKGRYCKERPGLLKEEANGNDLN